MTRENKYPIDQFYNDLVMDFFKSGNFNYHSAIATFLGLSEIKIETYNDEAPKSFDFFALNYYARAVVGFNGQDMILQIIIHAIIEDYMYNLGEITANLTFNIENYQVFNTNQAPSLSYEMIYEEPYIILHPKKFLIHNESINRLPHLVVFDISKILAFL